MDLITAAAAVVGTIFVLKIRKTAKGKKYTCHADGSTDCPCYNSEKARAPFTPAQKFPTKVTLKPGEAAWMCTCGQSKNYPFCDGTHRKVNAAEGTTFAPKKVETEKAEGEDLWMCQCGHSKNKPFCDGSHKALKLASTMDVLKETLVGKA